MKLATLVCLCSAATLPGAEAVTPIDERGYQSVLASNRGKLVLVNFWATWCAPCRKEMPELAALQKRLPASDFTLVTVSVDERQQARAAGEFLAASGVRPGAISNRPWTMKLSTPWSGASGAAMCRRRFFTTAKGSWCALSWARQTSGQWNASCVLG